MTVHSAVPLRFTLPLPAFVLHPFTAVVIATLHVYLGAGHLLRNAGGVLFLSSPA